MTTTNNLDTEQQFADEFWARCLVIMKTKNFTQQGLSEILGWNKRRIETLVSGHRTPSLLELKSLVEKLNISSEYLLSGNEDNNSESLNTLISELKTVLKKYEQS